MKKKSLVVSLDFDGTLVRTDKYPVFDPTPLPGCLETLRWLKEDLGAKFILLTQRDHSHTYNAVLGKAVWKKPEDPRVSVLQEAINWCEDQGIELWGVNENPGQSGWSVSRKVYSDIIIDDRCAGIDLTSDGYVDWEALGVKLRKQYGKQ